MKYEEMSDFEINNNVARALGLDIKEYQDRSGSMVWFTVKNKEGNDYFDYIDYKDFCNKVEDAWPVITGNNISIVATDSEWIALPDNAVIDGITGDATSMIYVGDECVISKNPLRAAMIVFLRMHEVDK